MKLFSIGFTKRSAEDFFTRLEKAGVRRIVDVRLNNTSQIAGFAKSRELQYFLRVIAGIGYVHMPELAPTQDILDAYKKEKGSWGEYERKFRDLLKEREIADSVIQSLQDGDCLLCSEYAPEQCHRRLVAEYVQAHRKDVEIVHL